MKKYFIVAAALFTLSCQSDDTKAKEQENQAASSSNALYGKWKVVNQLVNGEDRGFAPGSVEFKENGEFLGLTGVGFKYNIDGDTLVLKTSETAKPDKCKIVLSDIEKGSLKFETMVQDTLLIVTVFQKENN